MSFSLTLSGGGGLGVAHIGALRVLEHKYSFDYYAGVSAGAIVAAAHAVGYTADEISKIVHDQNFFALAFDFSKTNFGLLRGEKVLQLLEHVFEEKTFEDVKRENKILRVYATDFANGNRVCLNTGSIAKAVMASLSVPVLFDPLEYQNKFLVDGGLSGNFPLEETLAEYTGQCIGIDVGTSLDENINFSEKTFFGKPSGIQKTLERTFRIFFKNQQSFDPTHDQIERIICPDVSQFKTIDIHRLKEIEAVGIESAKDC